MADRTIRFTSRTARKGYPEELRQVLYYSKERNETFDFLTNSMGIPAMDVALAYKSRWNIEAFFKWMKQHLRIKEFYGTSENAVKIQIYSAITAYCLVALVERRLRLDMPTYTVLRILSLVLFEKVPLEELFKEYKEPDYQNDIQLYLNFFSGHVWADPAPTVKWKNRVTTDL